MVIFHSYVYKRLPEGSQIGSSSQHIPTIGANKSHVPNHQAVQKIMCHNPLPHESSRNSTIWKLAHIWPMISWFTKVNNGDGNHCNMSNYQYVYHPDLRGMGRDSSAKAGWNPFLPCSAAFTPKHQLRQRFRQLFHLITASDLFWLPINGGKIRSPNIDKPW